MLQLGWIESKNVAKQGLTKQLKDYKQIAQDKGLKMQLYVRQDTKLSKSLLKSGIEILRFPW